MIQWTPDGYCYAHGRYRCERCRKAEEREWDYGLFEWRSDAHYTRGTAIRVYSSKAVAQRAADKMSGNVVVRQVAKEPR